MLLHHLKNKSSFFCGQTSVSMLLRHILRSISIHLNICHAPCQVLGIWRKKAWSLLSKILQSNEEDHGVRMSKKKKMLVEKMSPFFLNVRKGNIIFRRTCKGQVPGP